MKSPILILHGWQAPSKKYHVLQQLLTSLGYDVHCPDLPGFGDEPLTKSVMTLNDYGKFVKNYLDKKDLKRVVIVGHSFGGRIGTKFAVLYPEKVEKLIITGSPLIKRTLSFKKRTISLTAKIVKPIMQLLPEHMFRFFQKMIYFLLKEWDYYKAGTLRETFKQIINEDLKSSLNKISCPVLILWGEHDTVVSLTDGKKIASLIHNSQFIALPNATHKLPYEDPKSFSKEVHRFLSI